MKSLLNRGSWMVTVPLVAINLAYLYFFFLPGKGEIESMRSDMDSKQQYLAASASRLVEINRVQHQLESARQYNDRWQRQSLRAEDASRLFSDMNRHASNAGVAVTRFEPRHGEEMDYLSRIPLRLASKGSFHQIFRLLGELEKLPETVWIDSLQFRALKQSSDFLSADADEGASVQSDINLAIFAVKTEDSD